MTRQSKNSINLYEGYRQLLSRQKNDKGRQRVKLILPLALLAAILLAVAGSVVIKNFEKKSELDRINSRIAELESRYTEASAISAKHAELQNKYSAMTFSRMMFNVYPPLNKPLIQKVRDCAYDGTIFKINAYRYDEESMTLVVDAAADSVNELPKFVERLRETGLFSGVQYTGYTSDQAADYFCTVGCTLQAGEDEAEDEAEAEGTVTTSTNLNAASDGQDTQG